MRRGDVDGAQDGAQGNQDGSELHVSVPRLSGGLPHPVLDGAGDIRVQHFEGPGTRDRRALWDFSRPLQALLNINSEISSPITSRNAVEAPSG